MRSRINCFQRNCGTKPPGSYSGPWKALLHGDAVVLQLRLRSATPPVNIGPNRTSSSTSLTSVALPIQEQRQPRPTFMRPIRHGVKQAEKHHYVRETLDWLCRNA